MSNQSGSYLIKEVLLKAREQGILDKIGKEQSTEFVLNILRMCNEFELDPEEILEGVDPDLRIRYDSETKWVGIIEESIWDKVFKAAEIASLSGQELVEYNESITKDEHFYSTLSFVNQLKEKMYRRDETDYQFRVRMGKMEFRYMISEGVKFEEKDRPDLTEEEKKSFQRELVEEFGKLWKARWIKMIWESQDKPILTNQHLSELLDIEIDILETYFKRIELTSEHV